MKFERVHTDLGDLIATHATVENIAIACLVGWVCYLFKPV